MTDEEKRRTNSFVQGSWATDFNQNGIQEKIFINIQRHRTTLSRYKGGIEFSNETFDTSLNWFGDFHLCFMHGNMRYYIRYADESTLIFGEQLPPQIGSQIWEHEFQRM